MKRVTTLGPNDFRPVCGMPTPWYDYIPMLFGLAVIGWVVWLIVSITLQYQADELPGLVDHAHLGMAIGVLGGEMNGEGSDPTQTTTPHVSSSLTAAE